MSDLAPLFDLRLQSPRLELGVGTPKEIDELGALARNRAEWTSPIQVAISGLEPALALFGAA